MSEGLYQIDPVNDPRWENLVRRHPKASIFHTVNWLRSLHDTYGYEPVVYTTSQSATELQNGIVFCRVASWMTGRRLVSLPFSDHCEPLCSSSEETRSLLAGLKNVCDEQHLRYLEVRPVCETPSREGGHGFKPSAKYVLHTVDLRSGIDQLFRSFDKDCVQRRIHRAERAGMSEKVGRSEELLKSFYAMFVATRGRHHVPPIPYLWFKNLTRLLGDSMQVRLAYRNGEPISAILTLHFRGTVYYKYGCSDTRHKRFGATPWLLWRAIEEARSQDAINFDLGRSEASNAGLLAFKNHWASQSAPLVYWKFPEESFIDSVDGWKLNLAKRVFSCMPNPLLRLTGRLIYRHIG